jgi:hypothetical protein
VLREAWKSDGADPIVAAALERFVEANPDLWVVYADVRRGDAGPRWFARWQGTRGESRDLAHYETEAWYELAPVYGDAAQFARWTAARPDLKAADHLAWASAFDALGASAEAWRLLAEFYPDLPSGRGSAAAAERYRKSKAVPDDTADAQTLVASLATVGTPDEVAAVVLEVARRPGANPWFLRKAAHIQGGAGKHGEAVDAMLRAVGARKGENAGRLTPPPRPL